MGSAAVEGREKRSGRDGAATEPEGSARPILAAGLTVAAAAAYGYVALFSPFRLEKEALWRALPLSAIVSCGVLLVLMSLRRWLLFVGTAAVVATGIAMIAWSRTIGPALAAAAILLVVSGVGDSVQNWLAPSEATPWAERFAVSVPLGVAVLGTAVFALGELAWLSTSIVIGVLAIGAALSIPRLRRWIRRDGPPVIVPRSRKESKSRKSRSAAAGAFPKALVAATAVLALAWAVAPEYLFDAMNYHQPVPRDWLRAGAIVNVPYWHSHFAHLAEAFFVFPLAFGGAGAVTLTVYAWTIATVAAAFALTRSLFSADAAPWAAALFAATPLVADLGSHVYADPLATLAITALILVCLRLPASPAPAGTAAIAGLLAGAAVGTKLNTAFALVVPALFLVLLAARRRIPRGSLVTAGFASGLVAIPWYWMTGRFTGNPVFPFLNGWFRSPLSAPANGLMNAFQYGIDRSPRSWLRLPLALTFQTNRFGENLRPGSLGIVLLLLPLVLLVRPKALDGRHVFVGAVAAVYAIGWSLTFQHARYLTVVFPVAAAFAGGAVASIKRGGARRIALGAVGVALAAQLVLFSARKPEPWRLVTGNETPRDYLRRVIPAIDCVLTLNGVATAGDRVASVGTESLRYYVSSPIDMPSESPLFDRSIAGLSGESLRDALWAAGDRFLLLRESPKTPSYSMGQPDFLQSYTEPVCRLNQLNVLKLLSPGTRNP